MADLRQMISGFQVSQALHAVATLGIPDLLADGPRSSEELAREAGADADAVYRLLRALAREGVFEERPDRHFALTDVGARLRRDVPGSLHAFAAHAGRPYHWNAWSGLVDAVRTGEPSFPRLHGLSAWEYRVEHPEEGELFDAWMTAQTRLVDEAIVAGYDFARFAHIVDVGGGHGAFLETILRAAPAARGTLFDQEHVLAGAPVRERIEHVAGSFFDSVPRGGDAYVLKSVVHDWGDEDAFAILRTCAAALEADARVLLVERDLSDAAAPWLDLQMLVMLGGRERTEEEYAALFRAAGLEPVGATPTGAGFAVFEAQGAATSPKR